MDQKKDSTLKIGSSDSYCSRKVLDVAAIPRDAGSLEFWLEKEKDLHKAKDDDDNTVLHWAVKKNRVDIVKLVLKYHSGLCFLLNRKEETPLCMGVRLACFEIVKLLIECIPDSIKIGSKHNKNVLHLAVEFRRFEIVEFLTENIDLSQLINQPIKYEKNTSDGKKDEHASAQGKDPQQDNVHSSIMKDQQSNSLESEGNTPLHIAASIKNLHMVKLLLNVNGVNKDAVNKEGYTPLDIARENTEYHESFKIIEKLVDYPKRSRPFLYSAPAVSHEKYETSQKNLNEAFAERRGTELVVSVLLATMAFTAAFAVPGGFRSETEPPEEMGSPILIKYTSFKLFLIFDCVAFFVSLFVALMWTISSPLATDDPMLFMTITAPVLCLAFAFMAYAFMLAVYAVVAHKVSTLAWVILGSSVFIYLLGNLAFLHQIGKAVVKRARIHRLSGVPCVLDDLVEYIWIRAERVGFLNFVRYCDETFSALLTGHHGRRKGSQKKRQSNSDTEAKARSGRVANCPSSFCSPEFGVRV